METQKIVNLLNDSNNKSPKFATRKWYLINDQMMYNMVEETKIIQPLSLKQKSLNQIFVIIKPNLCDYSDAYILVTRDIKLEDVAADTNVSFKNCAPFTRCVT